MLRDFITFWQGLPEYLESVAKSISILPDAEMCALALVILAVALGVMQ